MIVFGESWAYSVRGRKVDELLEFINKNIANTHLQEDEPVSVVTDLLDEKVAELNDKYPKTVKYRVLIGSGKIRIGAHGSVIKGISIRMIIARPFTRGGEL